ncbi:MAG: PhoH family protein [Acidobacteria bacterium]|nr:PhoH family protein [Acidobacteriota bacterium]
MSFVSREMLRLAIQALDDFTPLLVVSLPCMLADSVSTAKNIAEARKNAKPFGVTEETAWLDLYFRVPGGPPGKPYYIPSTRQWVSEEYSGKTLQRLRKDRDGWVFHHPDAKRWALRPDAAQNVVDKVLKEKGKTYRKVPLVALLAWMWRKKEISSLDSAMRNFIGEIGFNRDDLIPLVYSDEVPASFKDAGLADAPLNDDDIAEVLGIALPPRTIDSIDAFTETLENSLRAKHFIAPEGFVQRIVSGWLIGDIVVLVGPPGTGKTFLATSIGAGLMKAFGERFFQISIEVSADYDIGQFLGYENLAGEFTAGRFAREVLLSGDFNDPRLVVLDEWNLAQIDNYFAPVLSAIESHLPLRFPGRVDFSSRSEDERKQLLRAQPLVKDGQWALPESTFFLATCNSWVDEPDTRLPLSGPVKRRCTILTMPNVLLVRYNEKKDAGIIEVCDTLIRQEADTVRARRALGQASAFDLSREASLNTYPQFSALPEEARTKLLQTLRKILDDAANGPVFTVGILRDVLLATIFANDPAAALGRQIADKVLHQLQGSPDILNSIVQITKDLPNAAEIEALAKRMGAASSERRIRPVV